MHANAPSPSRGLLEAAIVALAIFGATATDLPAIGGHGGTGQQATDLFSRDGFIRGLSLEGGRRPISASDLGAVLETGAEWIAQIPFGFQQGRDDPAIRMPWERRVWWAESDEGIRETTRLARQLGLRVLLKPQLWIGRGIWIGEIAMTSEEGWTRWFESYGEFILHYAHLAEELDIEMLAVGTELQGTTHREADWQRLIDSVRQVYGGRLTYSANWNASYLRVPFWESLDYIGVSAYFPVPVESGAIEAGPEAASRAIRRAWEPHRRQLAGLAERVDRPLLFTEAGYRSLEGALEEPWQWRNRGQVDLIAQEAAYDALLATFWEEEWFGGVFFWNWSPRREGGPRDRGYTPRNKPASEVMARWFARGTRPRLFF